MELEERKKWIERFKQENQYGYTQFYRILREDEARKFLEEHDLVGKISMYELIGGR